MMRMKQWPRNIIQALETNSIPLQNYVLSFFFIIVIRHFLECFAVPFNYLNLSSAVFGRDIMHFGLSYVLLAMLLSLLFYYATNTSMEKIVKVIMPAFTILWLMPCLNLLFSHGEGENILYLLPGYDINLLYSYSTFFGGFFGVTTGLKIEIALGLVGCFCYFQAKLNNVLHSVIYTWVSYTLIFCWGATPFFLKWLLTALGYHYYFSGELMLNFYLVTVMIFAVPLLYLANKKIFMSLLRDGRALRVLHYELMVLLGVAIALSRTTTDITDQFHFSSNAINIILTLIAVYFSCLFSIVMNNIADVKIDVISNQDRPLIKNEIKLSTYQSLGMIFMVVSLFYADMVNSQVFLLVAVTMGSYYLYSMPPLRLKRVTLFSKLVISLNSIALVMLGFILIKDGMYNFPNSLFAIFFIGFTLAANFIDLKDVKGDKAAHIATLPVVLGVKQTKFIIGVGFWLTYMAFYALLQNRYMLPVLFVAGGMQFYLINKKQYNEKPVLLFHLLSVIFLIGYFLALKIYFN